MYNFSINRDNVHDEYNVEWSYIYDLFRKIKQK